MNSIEVGTKLVALFNEGKMEQIYQELYSPEIISVEADGMESVGMEGVAKKNEWWEENFEMHSCSAKGPYPHGDKFILIISMDVTHKPSSKRNASDECGLYTVKDGRIVREEFFYEQNS